MKKSTLWALFSLLSTSMVYAQKTLIPNTKPQAAQVKNSQDAFLLKPGTYDTKKWRKVTAAFPSTYGTKEHVGSTTYDLQTNGSMQRRILSSGNTVSAAWTWSNEINPTATSAYADRGTGYVHYNGTSWSAAPAARIEPMRTGFGSMAIDGNGNEIIVAHDATDGLVLNRKTAGTWSTTQLTTSPVPHAIWPHIATSGNWLYIIASAIDSNTKSNGIRYGYFFSRSNDNGATWIDNMIPMPLIDSVGHYRGGGNSYAISASGSNVAILFGDLATDLTLLTSTDNGATWNSKVIWDWPLDNFDFASTNMTDVDLDNIPDTLTTCDGSHTLAMDASGAVHLAFPAVRVYKPGGTAGYNFFYATSMVYYNSIVDSLTVVDNTFYAFHDCDDDGSIGIGANYSGSDAQNPGAIYNSIGTITQPSISIVSGAPQTVLLAYTYIMDNDTTVDDGVHPFYLGASQLEGQNYRDVFVAVSTDNGGVWNPFPVNVSKTAHFEEAFVTTPEIVSGNDFNLLYQGDIEPGTIMQNEDAYDDFFKNLAIVQKVQVSDLVTKSLDSTSPCGQSELPLGVKTVLNSNAQIALFPNPAVDDLTLSMNFVSTAKNVEIRIYDVSGKLMQQYSLNNINSKTMNIPVQHLAKGLYMLQVHADGAVLSRKFVRD